MDERTDTNRTSHLTIHGILIVLVILLLLIPFFRSTYLVLWFTTLFLYVALAQSWNLMAGYLGQFSLGHSAFLGVAGAGTTLVLFTGAPIYISILAGGVVAMGLALVVGVPFFRLRGAYFAFSTLGMSEILRIVLTGQDSLGGTGGIALPVYLDTTVGYYAQMAVAVVATVILYKIADSKFGISSVAIREDEDVAEALGVPVLRQKLAAFALSGLLAGLAGSVFLLNISYYSVNGFFDLTWSLRVVLMVVIGGGGTIIGAIIGATILVFLYNYLLVLPFWNLIIMGAIIIAFSIFAPRGIMGELLKIQALKSVIKRIEKRL